MVYLPTFTIKISQMWINIPYMDDMELKKHICQNGNLIRKPLSLFSQLEG